MGFGCTWMLDSDGTAHGMSAAEPMPTLNVKEITPFKDSKDKFVHTFFIRDTGMRKLQIGIDQCLSAASSS